MRIGKTSKSHTIILGPTKGNPVLDIPTVSQSADYATYLALQASTELARADERLEILEPPSVVAQPLTSMTYDVFPSVEEKDIVIVDTPVVRLLSNGVLANTNSSSKTKINVTHPPFMDRAWSGAVGVSVGTGTAIGTGGTNTTAWEAAVTEWGAHSRIMLSFDFNTYTDWFVPSQDELVEIYNNLASFPNLTQAITDGLLTTACSSSEAVAPNDADKVVAVNMTDGTTSEILKLNQAAVDAGGYQGALIPVRAIFDADGPFAVGDTGPGGGIVFFDNGVDDTWGRWLEAIDAIDGAWYYDLADYETFDADERFSPAGVLDAFPYDGTGNWQVYPVAGICTFPNVGIASTLWYVNEVVLRMQATLVSGSISGPIRQVVISGLTAP